MGPVVGGGEMTPQAGVRFLSGALPLRGSGANRQITHCGPFLREGSVCFTAIELMRSLAGGRTSASQTYSRFQNN